MKLLEYTPLYKNYNVRFYVDQHDNIFSYYFDIIDSVKIDNKFPFYNDLFLDVIYYNTPALQKKLGISINDPSDLFMCDIDELECALENKIIDSKQFNLAVSTANNLMKKIENGINVFVNRGISDYLKFKQ